ncbi:hypothetical protein NECAME_07967 [Necator americanus]|uniref:Uncharacterized protein n=1 Tax=Necator americanus TaxID=51031 RepID=W2TLC9_NECAM|nr:hypothetical protein NECAME_07967 [Necator americanus]ETN82439.1 hypothetical protein NECAME_07967 [Necator americanus]
MDSRHASSDCVIIAFPPQRTIYSPFNTIFEEDKIRFEIANKFSTASANADTACARINCQLPPLHSFIAVMSFREVTSQKSKRKRVHLISVMADAITNPDVNPLIFCLRDNV